MGKFSKSHNQNVGAVKGESFGWDKQLKAVLSSLDQIDPKTMQYTTTITVRDDYCTFIRTLDKELEVVTKAGGTLVNVADLPPLLSNVEVVDFNDDSWTANSFEFFVGAGGVFDANVATLNAAVGKKVALIGTDRAVLAEGVLVSVQGDDLSVVDESKGVVVVVRRSSVLSVACDAMASGRARISFAVDKLPLKLAIKGTLPSDSISCVAAYNVDIDHRDTNAAVRGVWKIQNNTRVPLVDVRLFVEFNVDKFPDRNKIRRKSSGYSSNLKVIASSLNSNSSNSNNSFSRHQQQQQQQSRTTPSFRYGGSRHVQRFALPQLVTLGQAGAQLTMPFGAQPLSPCVLRVIADFTAQPAQTNSSSTVYESCEFRFEMKLDKSMGSALPPGSVSFWRLAHKGEIARMCSMQPCEDIPFLSLPNWLSIRIFNFDVTVTRVAKSLTNDHDTAPAPHYARQEIEYQLNLDPSPPGLQEIVVVDPHVLPRYSNSNATTLDGTSTLYESDSSKTINPIHCVVAPHELFEQQSLLTIPLGTHTKEEIKVKRQVLYELSGDGDAANATAAADTASANNNNNNNDDVESGGASSSSSARKTKVKKGGLFSW